MALMSVGTAVGLLTAWSVFNPGGHYKPPLRLPQVAFAQAARATTKPTLWVLSIGVSKYKVSDLNLRFADADASAIAQILQRQSNGPLYGDVKAQVLTDAAVTRESVLGAMGRILSNANVDDVVVIFLAGHGVQDRSAGTFYFLPADGKADNLVTAGLRMSDFDDMVRSIRRNVRAAVLMLDTCHAGAANFSKGGLVVADDPGSRLSTGDGFFLLAAGKPGEFAREPESLKHGAFTHALLQGLGGSGDANHDGILTVSELFGFVAREVPLLTANAQHPYSKVEGTDLMLAAPAGGATNVVVPALPRNSKNYAPNTIGVMEFESLRPDKDHEWVGKAVRIALNTELSKVRKLRVFSPDLIDRAGGGNRGQLDVAQDLGIRRLLTGSYHVVGETIRIDAQIINTDSGMQEGSDSVEGKVGQFFELQKRLVRKTLRRLPVEVSAEEGESIEQPSNTSVSAYRLLLEAEGVVDEGGPTPSPSAAEPSTPATPRSTLDSLWWKFSSLMVTPAYADETPTEARDTDASVRAFLEEYRLAQEAKDIERVAALYVTFSDKQRQAHREYWEVATDLRIELSNIVIEARDTGVAASFTRRDRFIDRESAKAQRTEARLPKLLVRAGSGWKFSK